MAERGPGYVREGLMGGYPLTPKESGGAQETLPVCASHVPDRLTEKRTAPILEALRQWETGRPGERVALVVSGELPVRTTPRREALAAWKKAARRPKVNAYSRTERRRLYAAADPDGDVGHRRDGRHDGYILLPEIVSEAQTGRYRLLRGREGDGGGTTAGGARMDGFDDGHGGRPAAVRRTR